MWNLVPRFLGRIQMRVTEDQVGMKIFKCRGDAKVTIVNCVMTILITYELHTEFRLENAKKKKRFGRLMCTAR